VEKEQGSVFVNSSVRYTNLKFLIKTRFWLAPVLSLGFALTGCCPNLLERSLKRFLLINLGEVKEKRFQLFEPEGRVLESPGTSLRFIKKGFRASEK
jgi:hypothetical protein